MAATLAAAGKNPVTHAQVIDAGKVPNVLAVMSTAGLYDDSGKWLYHTGLPAKSGVGGGIIAVSPGKFGIAVVAPPLDAAGNSVKAQRAIDAISAALGGNPYGESQTQTTTVQVTSPPRPSFEIYGFAMLDMGHNFKQIHPDWFDTLRLTKLPASPNEFGEDNSTFSGVRQSRLGVKSTTPTKMGDEDHLRVRTGRHRRGLGADHVPPATRSEVSLAPASWSPFTDPDAPPPARARGPTGLAWAQKRPVPMDADQR